MPATASLRALLLPVLAVLVCLLVACADEPVTTGEGEIPGSVPDDFPVPPGAVVGATMVDRTNHRTEFRLSTSDQLTRVVRFFTVGLVERGYVVDDLGGDATRWTIRFSRDILRGTVLIEPGGSGETIVRVSLNRS